MLPVSTENHVGGVWGKISKAGMCVCADVERGSERRKRKIPNGLNLQFSISWVIFYIQIDIHLSSCRHNYKHIWSQVKHVCPH